MKNPQDFLKFLVEYLKESGFYFEVDDFIHDGKIQLVSLENNLLFIEFLVGEVQMARLENIAPHFSKHKEAHEIAKDIAETISTNIPELIEEENDSKESKEDNEDYLLDSLCNSIDALTYKIIKKMQYGLFENVFEQEKVPAEPIIPTLSPSIIQYLTKLNERLAADYTLRHEMLVTRARATYQSMQWADRVKGDPSFPQVVASMSASLPPPPVVFVEDITRASLRSLCPTLMNESVSSSLRKFLIGKVPDRGGRTADVGRMDWKLAKRDQQVDNTTNARGGRGGRGGRGRWTDNRRGGWRNEQGPSRSGGEGGYDGRDGGREFHSQQRGSWRGFRGAGRARGGGRGGWGATQWGSDGFASQMGFQQRY
ncbi:putative Protein of unknown function (DUF2465) [Monocercomonoides exilis]|uniref:putative Protein of unknown function (DUF2465) n=1 Tax=Monocercomonoides exilis TaxID=2049356 RepID=UPI00355A0748|nr:putative Protein of unknown function (DUF2465) [Monocercomonoides exilis]|eukprot:MONOS_8658.1-p1 / transcript=MONOS_8658.1 / gene=MONOS_8658 / organism=Monocercomonoides_exilis_PA203 / gene_product=unspecified product / transcript_product=unspecified product / location=Mono_scaffold00332:24938-26184(+) / protein_length=368 / sequence_SO=supercontig / SO=protein_coding / is_pseudo=false